jgi:hypothetical protein
VQTKSGEKAMMDPEELAGVLHKLIGMVSSVELMTTAVVEILVQNAIIDRDVLLKGLLEQRDKLDPTYSKGSFDAVIERLSPKAAPGLN